MTSKKPATPEELNELLLRQATIKTEIKSLANQIITIEKSVIPLRKKRESLTAEFLLLDTRRFNIDGSEVKFVQPKTKTKQVSIPTPTKLELSRAIKDAFGQMSQEEQNLLLSSI